MNKFILYYSHNSLPILMEEFFQKKLIETVSGIPIVSVIKNPRTEYSGTFADINLKIDFKYNNWSSIYQQMGAGIDAILKIKEDVIVYIAEHDVIYPPSYFANLPPDEMTFLKNLNLYFLMKRGYIGPFGNYIQSQTISTARLFKSWLDEVTKIKGPSGYKLKKFNNEHSSLDVRHGFNYTGPRYARTEKNYITSLPYWGNYKDILNTIPGIIPFRQDKSQGIE
jgi:hypothetical protein